MPRRILNPVVSGLIVLSTCVSCRREPATTTAPPAAVRVQRLRAEPIQIVTRFNGTVGPLQSAEMSFKASGTVARVLQVQLPDGSRREVSEGDVVSAADATQPLASLETADDQHDYDSAQLRLAWARRASGVVQQFLLRVRPSDLWRPPSDDQLNKLMLQHLQFCLEYESADTALRQAKRRLDAADVWTPFDHATVVRKLVGPGQQVGAGQIAFGLMDLTQMHVDACLPEGLTTVQITSDEPAGRTLDGRVTQPRGPIVVDHPEGLRPGQKVTVIHRREQSAILVDASALRRGGSAPTDFAVFKVADERGQKVLHRQKVELDGVYDEHRVRIKTGIKEGDSIVMGARSLLHDNQIVRVAATDADLDDAAISMSATLGRGQMLGIDCGAAVVVTLILLFGGRLIGNRITLWSVDHRQLVLPALLLLLVGGFALLPRVGLSLVAPRSTEPPVQVRLFGAETWALQQLAERTASIMNSVAGISSIHDDWGPDVLGGSQERPQIAASSIQHRNGEPCLTVSCQTLPGVLPRDVAAKLDRELISSLPAGYRAELGGEPERRIAAITAARANGPAVLLAGYLALVLISRSVARALIGAIAALFGVVAAIAGLLIFAAPFTPTAAIGAAGVALVVLACTLSLMRQLDQERQRGRSFADAIDDVVSTLSRRLIPSSIATAVAFAALAIQSGPDWRPMYFTMIVGLLVTPIVVLIVVPVLYASLIRWDVASLQIPLEAPPVIAQAESPVEPEPEPAPLPAKPKARAFSAVHITIREDEPEVARLMAARRAAG
jgi:hypothetical protein